MRPFEIPLKNASVFWWRSLTLGFFVLVLCFMLVFSRSMADAANRSMRDAVTDAVTGHVQLRPLSSTETDMADIMKASWDRFPVFSPGETAALVDACKVAAPGAEIVPRLRGNVLLISDRDKMPVRTIAFDPSTGCYRRAFSLSSGRYLSKPDDLLLTESQAKKLRVTVGDSVAVLTTDLDGYAVDGLFTVCGIGTLRSLDMFSFAAAYCSLDGFSKVLGAEAGTATDVVAVLPDIRGLNGVMNRLEGVSSIARLTDYRGMGSFMMAVASGIGIFFYGMLVFLMIIMSVLIANLVFLTCLERYREIGTYRALGFSRLRVALLFVAEIGFVSAAFGGAGMLLGTGLVLYFGVTGFPAISASWEYSMGKRLYPEFAPGDLLVIAVTAAVFIFFASLYPAWKAVNARPADALRED